MRMHREAEATAGLSQARGEEAELSETAPSPSNNAEIVKNFPRHKSKSKPDLSAQEACCASIHSRKSESLMYVVAQSF